MVNLSPERVTVLEEGLSGDRFGRGAQLGLRGVERGATAVVSLQEGSAHHGADAGSDGDYREVLCTATVPKPVLGQGERPTLGSLRER